MNNNINNVSQEIHLKNRKDLTITGVKKINSLNEELFDIETSLGRMKIEGKGLEMLSLDIDKGVLQITGSINQVVYLDNTKNKKDGSFFQKLFK